MRCTPTNPADIAKALRTFDTSTKVAKKKTSRSIVGAYKPGTLLSGNEATFARRLLEIHPKAEGKIGVGIRDLCIGTQYGSRCFQMIRIDETRDTFSFHDALKSIEQAARSDITEAFRNAVFDQIKEFKNANVNEDGTTWTCVMCQARVDVPHVDHDTRVDFKVLTDLYRATYLKKGVPDVIKTNSFLAKQFKDSTELKDWQDFHRRNAKLQILCAQCNTSKSANPTVLLCDAPSGAGAGVDG